VFSSGVPEIDKRSVYTDIATAQKPAEHAAGVHPERVICGAWN
jgi:ABC-type lipoprotein release transport system permease subunit